MKPEQCIKTNQNHTWFCWWISLTHNVLFPEYFYWPLPPPTQGLCVGMYSTCEVHAKYALVQSDASTPLLVTHFQRSLGSKWPKFNDIFQPKKSSTTQLLLASTGHILVDEQEPSKGGSARRRKKLIQILRIFGNPIWSPYLLVSHLNTERNIRSESISMLWVNQDFWRGAYDRF